MVVGISLRLLVRAVCFRTPMRYRTQLLTSPFLVQQGISTLLAASAELRLSVNRDEWRNVVDAAKARLAAEKQKHKLFTSVIWASAVQGRLEDRSTLAFLAACRSLLERSPRAVADLQRLTPVSTTLRQESEVACAYARWLFAC